MSNLLHASKFNFVCLDKWIYFSTFLMQIESTNQSWRKKLRNLSQWNKVGQIDMTKRHVSEKPPEIISQSLEDTITRNALGLKSFSPKYCYWFSHWKLDHFTKIIFDHLKKTSCWSFDGLPQHSCTPLSFSLSFCLCLFCPCLFCLCLFVFVFFCLCPPGSYKTYMSQVVLAGE